MTRETKLGVVVAGSFLALVGGVVVARLKQADAPGEAAVVAVAPPTPVEHAPPAPAPEQKKHDNPVSGDALANAGAIKMPSATPDPAPVQNQAPSTNPSAAATPAPTAVPMDAQPAAPVTAATTPATLAPPTTPAPAFPVESKPDPAAFVGPPAPTEEPAATPVAVVVNPMPPAADSKPAPPAPAAADTAVPPTPVTTLPEKPMTTEPAPAAVQVTPTVPGPMVPAPIPEPPAPPPPSPTATVIKQPPPADAPPVGPPPLNPEVAKNAVATVTVVPASGTNTGASLDPPRVPAAAPPREQSIAPARPAAPPEPKRDSYLEEQYRWTAGDSFNAISTKYYMSPKYADALLKYNQDYPLATREIRQSPPALAPGQIVWVPPVRILERDYANTIGGLTPIGTPTSRPTVEPVAPPAGLANSGFGNTAGQLYRVRAQGESLQEIARRTLGNSALAARVQGLNPTLSPDPRLPIPAGTVLRLPGEARVEAADKP
jgi:hypothetical protein